MENLETTALDEGVTWRVVVAGEAGAAISQLRREDQDAIGRSLIMLEEQGPRVPALLKRMNTTEPFYVLRLSGASDLRVVVHVEGHTIKVTDVVRAATLRNVFHADAS